jgi:hypothetical protein
VSTSIFFLHREDDVACSSATTALVLICGAAGSAAEAPCLAVFGALGREVGAAFRASHNFRRITADYAWIALDYTSSVM